MILLNIFKNNTNVVAFLTLPLLRFILLTKGGGGGGVQREEKKVKSPVNFATQQEILWEVCHDKYRTFINFGRRGGLMVSVLDSGSSGLGLGPGRGHCVVFLGKTLYSHGASLHPGV